MKNSQQKKPEEKKMSQKKSDSEKRGIAETTYIKDEKTGLYIYVNPSGSMAYNYLYGRDTDVDSEDEENQE